MVIFDRAQATRDPLYPDEFLVTVFWRDSENKDSCRSGHASRNHGVVLKDLCDLSKRLRKIGFNFSGDPVRRDDTY